MPYRKVTWVTIWRRIVEFLFRSDLEYSEFQSCMMAFMWGLWLTFNPIDHGVVYSSLGVPPTLDVLRGLFPTWLWSTWFLMLGTGHTIALAKRQWTARRFFSFVATITWLFVALYLGLTNVRMVAVPTTLFFSLGAAWGFWRLRSCYPRAATSPFIILTAESNKVPKAI